MEKSADCALVIVPAEELWAPLDGIRRAHDPQFDVVMPHVTLLYPFTPLERFGEVASRVSEACAGIAPFAVKLARFEMFAPEGGPCTVWLDPEPSAAVAELHAALLAAVPHCDDTERYADGFRPHLSVAQTRDRATAEDLVAELSREWRPLRFDVRDATLIARAPGAAFRIVQRLPLLHP